ncbi:uncharacterized protein LOC110701661 [Chenopodium quinoa]|uniref:uncharacterized protein LOC110701661 n=1 Tax=Chenopodium quinoa TaxID=63459 RepID=UPI000B7785B1|nr:uncharacterized protein LOC110701661 [Chenopodium quinoa]
MSLRQRIKKERSSKVNSVIKRLTKITENIAGIVSNQGKAHNDLNAFGKVFKRIAAANPPTYLGKLDPASLENWVREFDKLFDAINCPEELNVNNAVYYLREEADLWWSQRRDDLLSNPNFGWAQLKEALREKFYPAYLRKQKCMEFTNLRMGNMTINEYYSKFIELMRFSPEVVPTEALKAQRFEQGLTLTLQGKLGGVTFETLDELGHREYECYKKVSNEKLGKPQDEPKLIQPSGFNPKPGPNNNSGAAPKGRVFEMNSREAATASDVVIGNFFICSMSTKVLFDLGASHSFISRTLVDRLKLESLVSVSLDIAIPSGEVVVAQKCIRVYLLLFQM